MNRTVRCLALFALGVGAWACKGDPQGSLNRGTTTVVIADPQTVFVAEGSVTPILIEARDDLNQATEITSVSEAAGAGVSLARDWLFQPVFDANATTEAACTAIANASWTGAGCLVPRPNPTRLRYEVTGNTAGVTSISVTANGMTVDVPVTVTPLTVPATVSQALPASGIGLEIIRLTVAPPFSLDPGARIEDVQGPPGTGSFGFMNVGVDPGGTWIEYVQQGGTTGSPVISGVLFVGQAFELPTTNPVTAAASTLTGQDAFGTAPTVTLPTGGTTVIYDNPTMSDASLIGLPGDYYVVNITGGGTFDYTLTWDDNGDGNYHADLGTWFTDNPPAVFECIADGFGAQDGGPESTSGCVNSGSQVQTTATFDVVPPVIRHEYVVQ